MAKLQLLATGIADSNRRRLRTMIHVNMITPIEIAIIMAIGEYP
jgi:hypothetical protein